MKLKTIRERLKAGRRLARPLPINPPGEEPQKAERSSLTESDDWRHFDVISPDGKYRYTGYRRGAPATPDRIAAEAAVLTGGRSLSESGSKLEPVSSFASKYKFVEPMPLPAMFDGPLTASEIVEGAPSALIPPPSGPFGGMSFSEASEAMKRMGDAIGSSAKYPDDWVGSSDWAMKELELARAAREIRAAEERAREAVETRKALAAFGEAIKYVGKSIKEFAKEALEAVKEFIEWDSVRIAPIGTKRRRPIGPLWKRVKAPGRTYPPPLAREPRAIFPGSVSDYPTGPDPPGPGVHLQICIGYIQWRAARLGAA